MTNNEEIFIVSYRPELDLKKVIRSEPQRNHKVDI